jgi:hypothetical protein
VESLGELTPEVLQREFPGWRIFQGSADEWWATRAGRQQWTGPESLLKRMLGAADVDRLAERLCLQEWFDSLGPAQLEAVYVDLRETPQ